MEMKEKAVLEFHLGAFGKFVPLLVAVAFIAWAAVSESNVNGYVVAFFMAIIVGVAFAKDEQAYGKAVVAGLTKPMFAVVAMAVILAAISGKLISSSGVVQTIAIGVVSIGFAGKLFAVATFLITCLLSFSTGTSVGTYFVVIPILYPVGIMAGVDPLYMIGAIVSGAAFGDNLAPISDTTIASAATQDAELGMVVKTRMKYSLTAAAIALVGFGVLTKTVENAEALEAAQAVANPMSLVMLAVPAVIIGLCLMRKHLITALSWGVLTGIVVGLVTGIYTIDQLHAFPGGFAVTGLIIESISGCLGTIAMLVAVFSLLGVMEASGIFEEVGASLAKFATTETKTELTIIGCVGLLSMITGVISVAIVAMGGLVKDLGEANGVGRYRRANLMDCTGCIFCFLAPWTVHCVIPAMQAANFSPVTPGSIPFVNFYAIAMIGILIVSVVTGFGREK